MKIVDFLVNLSDKLLFDLFSEKENSESDEISLVILLSAFSILILYKHKPKTSIKGDKKTKLKNLNLINS